MAKNATVWLPYAQMQTAPAPLEVVSTSGTSLTLANGRTLIDSVASWWTACHGYNHPHIVAAIIQQASIMPHFMLGGLVNPQATRLAQRLSNLLPCDLDYVFYSESGSVAVEIAMKMALQYWINHQEKQKKNFIYFENGYHGDTFFTMSVSSPADGIHPPFEGVLPKQCLQPLPITDNMLEDFESWVSKNNTTIAALLIEPLVQGAGGMKMHQPSVLQAIVEICQKHNVLVIADEVFTGFGRTGTLFAIEQAQVIPDIICLSKALTGGTLPLAATIARKHVYDAFLGMDANKGLMHGTTFMGNALACSAANASLDLFEQEPRLSQVADIEGILKQSLSCLKDVPGVKDVRVKGAIGVVQLPWHLGLELNWFKQQFVDDGIWCRPFADIVYIAPALTIDTHALNHITTSLIRCIKEWSLRFYRK
jgi:adenosylmethionine-8-amino-7-oxononanoate aminotransferase